MRTATHIASSMVCLCRRSFSVPARVEEAIIQSWQAATGLTAGLLPGDQPVPRGRTKRKTKIAFRFLLFGAESSESINHVTGTAIKTNYRLASLGDPRRQLLDVLQSQVENSIVGALHHFAA